ncbi:hypothetical protein ACWD6I_26270 [Streptomyces sp. NPDC002454]
MDPEAARRRAERRAARVTAGAGELQERLADVLRGGLAGAEREGAAAWEETAARMVDAQAPGLAARVRGLGALPGAGPGGPARLVEECALLHLLVGGWLRRDSLPAPLAATVRTRVGLPSVPRGEPVPDRWLVLAQHDHQDPYDRGGGAQLTVRRIWVHGAVSGRTGLVLSYGAPGRAPELSLPVGGVVAATALPHPGAAWSRLDLGEVRGVTPPPPGGRAPGARVPAGGSVAAALAGYGATVAADPWTEGRAVTLAGVVPVLTGEGRGQVVEPSTGRALPFAPEFPRGAAPWRLVAFAGGTGVTVFGELGHTGLRPLAVWGADGVVVPLG